MNDEPGQEPTAPPSDASETPQEHQIAIDASTPEYYADSFSMGGSEYTVTLHFGVKVGPSFTKVNSIVRMNPLHAKMMAILLTRNLKRYEQELGEIIIPARLLEAKEIDLDQAWNGV